MIHRECNDSSTLDRFRIHLRCLAGPRIITRAIRTTHDRGNTERSFARLSENSECIPALMKCTYVNAAAPNGLLFTRITTAIISSARRKSRSGKDRYLSRTYHRDDDSRTAQQVHLLYKSLYLIFRDACFPLHVHCDSKGAKLQSRRSFR